MDPSAGPSETTPTDVWSELVELGTESERIAKGYGEISSALEGVSGGIPGAWFSRYLTFATAEYVLGTRLQELGRKHAWNGVDGPAWGPDALLAPIGRALCMRSSVPLVVKRKERARDLALFLGFCSRELVKVGGGLRRAGHERSAEDLSVWDVR